MIGGWEIQRQVAGRPWPEAKAERGDGTLGRLMVVPAAQAPEPTALVAWRLALAPLSLDHPGLPPLRLEKSNADLVGASFLTDSTLLVVYAAGIGLSFLLPEPKGTALPE